MTSIREKSLKFLLYLKFYNGYIDVASSVVFYVLHAACDTCLCIYIDISLMQ